MLAHIKYSITMKIPLIPYGQNFNFKLLLLKKKWFSTMSPDNPSWSKRRNPSSRRILRRGFSHTHWNVSFFHPLTTWFGHVVNYCSSSTINASCSRSCELLTNLQLRAKFSSFTSTVGMESRKRPGDKTSTEFHCWPRAALAGKREMRGNSADRATDLWSGRIKEQFFWSIQATQKLRQRRRLNS